MELQGLTAVVAGGTTGIGRATAMKLAEQGVRVFIFGRDQKDLDTALQTLGQVGEAYGSTGDQSIHADVERLFDEAVSKLGAIDMLVSSAGLGAGSIVDTDPKDWRYVIEVNLIGTMACSQLALRNMKSRGKGHIVMIGSLSAKVHEKGSDIYVATKSGLEGFADSLAKSVNEFGIRVTLIEPGLVSTDLNDLSEQERLKWQEESRILTADDVADAVIYSISLPQRAEVSKIHIRPHKQAV